LLLDFFRNLFATDFMPHVYCLREPAIVKLHLLSDSVISFSYAMIPLALVLVIRRRRDLMFPWMFGLFGVFILGCGLTHVMGVVTLWHPAYRLDGVVKAITAAASLLTALLLFRLLPQIEGLPSPAQLKVEIDRREQVEVQLRRFNEELEHRVADRTFALEESNHRLRESKEGFRTLTELVPNLLWTSDPAGHATHVSLRYRQYAGSTEQVLLGSCWRELAHPDDSERADGSWQDAVTRGEPYEIECRLRRFDGAYRWFVVRAVPMRDENGQIGQWLGSCTDINDLKTTQAELRRSNEELERFAYLVAHDLQEPLRNVSISVGMVRRGGYETLEPSLAKWLASAEQGAQRMHGMVRDLLTYSRSVDSADAPEETVSVEHAVHSALTNLAEAIAQSHASIQIESLPHVRVREPHLVQIFQNLVGNAIKYRKSEAPPIIRISARRNRDDWEFSVSDNGIGFQAEYSDKIFGVFKRLHQPDEYPGNGIGLAICARIVDHYGGRIWAESRSGQGATFRLTFPAEFKANCQENTTERVV
jgi:PAS domain S-box-containing protein